MDIDDILNKKEFQSLDYFLDKEFMTNTGPELYARMIEVFGEYKIARNYFYTSSVVLGNKRPYDYCLNNNQKVIFDELGRIENGILS